MIIVTTTRPVFVVNIVWLMLLIWLLTVDVCNNFWGRFKNVKRGKFLIGLGFWIVGRVNLQDFCQQ